MTETVGPTRPRALRQGYALDPALPVQSTGKQCVKKVEVQEARFRDYQKT